MNITTINNIYNFALYTREKCNFFLYMSGTYEEFIELEVSKYSSTSTSKLSCSKYVNALMKLIYLSFLLYTLSGILPFFLCYS
jgi:hypothetical protein